MFKILKTPIETIIDWGLHFCGGMCNNKSIWKVLLEELYPNPVQLSYILKQFDVDKIKHIKHYI